MIYLARTKIRSQKGIVGIVEIVASALLLIVMALLGMDVCLAVIGISMNDHACRDAARAASGANNKEKALSMAQAALRMQHPDGFFISQPALTGTSPPDFDYNDYNGVPPADTSPYVSVTSTCIVRIPAPIFFWGASFVKDGKLQFTQRYTYPIVRTQYIKYLDLE